MLTFHLAVAVIFCKVVQHLDNEHSERHTQHNPSTFNPSVILDDMFNLQKLYFEYLRHSYFGYILLHRNAGHYLAAKRERRFSIIKQLEGCDYQLCVYVLSTFACLSCPVQNEQQRNPRRRGDLGHQRDQRTNGVLHQAHINSNLLYQLTLNNIIL